ncbi:MAG: hypothetical protein C0410_15615 [Anaerolinea sp.]|nr:hypothetical protein [Anaerolinea sp.]
MALQGRFGNVGQAGLGLGLISRTRGTMMRIRSVIRPPKFGAEAARVVVKNTVGPLDQAFIGAYISDTVSKELWGYYKTGDLKAVLSLYLDSAANKYKYVVSKVTVDALSVEFDKIAIGNLSAISQIDTPGAGQITHEAAPLTA